MILSPDRKSLLVGDTAGNQLLFLDPATGAVQRRVPVADDAVSTLDEQATQPLRGRVDDDHRGEDDDDDGTGLRELEGAHDLPGDEADAVESVRRRAAPFNELIRPDGSECIARSPILPR